MTGVQTCALPISSLTTTLPYDALVLPGHGVPFYGLKTRIKQLADHHEDRRFRSEAIHGPHPIRVIAAILGIGGGLLLFRVRGTWFEPVADLASVLLLSIPEFLWGLILLFVFGVALELLPFTGEVGPGLPIPRFTGFLLPDSLIAGRLDVFFSACQHLILPSLALGLAFSPGIMRVLRSSLFDVYHEDYIAQARLRGLSENRILLGHAFKNAALPTLTLAGVQFGILFSGTLLVEVIYSYPGMGNLMVDAVRNADLPLIQAIGLTYCIVVLLINMAVDSLYVVLNPKLRVR